MKLTWIDQNQIIGGTPQGNASPFQIIDTPIYAKLGERYFFIHNDKLSLFGQAVGFKRGLVARWSYGPIGNSNEIEAYQFMKDVLDLLFAEGFIGIDSCSYNIYSSHVEWDGIFSKLGFIKQDKWATYLISLEDDHEKLFRKLQEGLRKNIRRLEKKDDLYIKDITEDKYIINDYVNVINETRKRNNLNPINGLSQLLDICARSSLRRYCVLYEGNNALACQGVILGKRVATEVVLGVSDYSIKSGIYAGDYLKWKMILRCKDQGINYYDLAGVSPFPINSKEEGIRRYKAKWGGEYLEYCSWEKALSSKYKIWKLMKVIKQRIVKNNNG